MLLIKKSKIYFNYIFNFPDNYDLKLVNSASLLKKTLRLGYLTTLGVICHLDAATPVKSSTK